MQNRQRSSQRQKEFWELAVLAVADDGGNAGERALKNVADCWLPSLSFLALFSVTWSLYAILRTVVIRQRANATDPLEPIRATGENHVPKVRTLERDTSSWRRGEGGSPLLTRAFLCASQTSASFEIRTKAAFLSPARSFDGTAYDQQDRVVTCLSPTRLLARWGRSLCRLPS